MTDAEAAELERLKIVVRLYEQSIDALCRELAASRLKIQQLSQPPAPPTPPAVQ